MDEDDKYDAIEVIADRIRKAFQARKAQVFDRPSKLSPRHDKRVFWTNAAKLCIDMGMEPVDYINAVFLRSNNQRGLFPHMIAGSFAARAVEESLICPTEQVLKTDMENELNALVRLTKSDDVKDYKPYLMDPLWRCYAFIRVAILPKDRDILGKYGEEALTQLTVSPGVKAAAAHFGLTSKYLKEALYGR